MRGSMRRAAGGLALAMVAGSPAMGAEGPGAAAFFGHLSCRAEKRLMCDPNGCRMLASNEGAGADVVEVDLPGAKVNYGTGRTVIPIKVIEATTVEPGKPVLARVTFPSDGRLVAMTLTAASSAVHSREAVTTYPPKPGEGVGRYIDVMACSPLSPPREPRRESTK